jgi:two-component system phosphate regulon sensor histidine kinase PhoR
MPARLLFPLLAASALAVAAASWMVSGRLEVAATAGLVSALATALTSAVLLRPLVARMDRLTSAARTVMAELTVLPATDTDDPGRLAEAVNAIAARARELARQQNTLTAVVDGMLEGIWITDAAGTIVRHNDALKQMLFAGQELIGQRPAAVSRSEALEAAVARACVEGAPTQLELAVEGVRPRTLAIQVSPLGREVGGSAAVFHDITELRRLEKVRKDFVANVSHEIRTPITAIRGYAETLMSGALEDKKVAADMVQIIHRQSERLSELVDDLLEISRLEAKEIQLAHGPVPLAAAANRAAEAVRQKATAKGVRLELAVPAQLVASGDERAVEAVLLNLLDNAVKYTNPGGKVTVSASATPGGFLIEVRDSGIGIEAKHLPRLFERFYRVDKGRSRAMGGTGLGLSIVKHLVTAMGGEVQVASEPGQGTTFTVQLPSSF